MYKQGQSTILYIKIFTFIFLYGTSINICIYRLLTTGNSGSVS